MDAAHRMIATFDPRRSLKARLGLEFGGLVLTLALVLSLLIGQSSRTGLEADRGELLADLAYQMAGQLDRGMFERYRDVAVMTALPSLRDTHAALDQQRAVLNQLQWTNADYAWIGLVDPTGRIRVATGGVLEGDSVAGLPWFAPGRQGPYLGDVHTPSPLEVQLAGDTPQRLVTIAMPLTPVGGGAAWVVSAYLKWGWAEQIATSLLRPGVGLANSQILVLNSAGRVMLGPADLIGAPGPTLPAEGGPGYRLDRVDGEERWLVGYARTQGYRTYPGLGWAVLVRQPATVAFAPATSTQAAFLGLGLGLGLLAVLLGWLLARRLTRPLEAIAAAAAAASEEGAPPAIPTVAGHDEVARLAGTLQDLVSTLVVQQEDLYSLNEHLRRELVAHARTEDELRAARDELEARVAARTRELAAANAELQEVAIRDSLTGLYNRRELDRLLVRQVRLAERYGRPSSLLILDIDHFKAVNDTYGHQMGDGVLRWLGGVLRSNVRAVDAVARYGGEEFAVVLPETTPDQAGVVAAHLLDVVARAEFPGPVPPAPSFRTVTISIGVASVPTDADTAAAWVAHADQALYAAKRAGRNRAVAFVAL